MGLTKRPVISCALVLSLRINTFSKFVPRKLSKLKSRHTLKRVGLFVISRLKLWARRSFETKTPAVWPSKDVSR
jgi:hypothetical protein